MNNVSQITKANRLTEQAVHEAAEELKESGIRPSSIEIYKFLGRGSLTTITNFLRTWNQEETHATTPITLINLPETLIKSTEQLITKIWEESQVLAEKEINSQREALRQAETLANEKITEAEAFSEEQSKQIEALETSIDALKKEKTNDHSLFLIEEKRLQDEIAHEKKDKTIFEQRFIETEKQLNETKSELNELNKNCKGLIEKAAKLEGELMAWKSIKPENNTKKPS